MSGPVNELLDVQAVLLRVLIVRRVLHVAEDFLDDLLLLIFRQVIFDRKVLTRLHAIIQGVDEVQGVWYDCKV